MHVNWWSENECVTFYFFTRTVSEFDKSILWWKKNGFLMYGNEPYWLYGALQIILATFYQFLTKEVFCQEVTFLSCKNWSKFECQPIRKQYFEIWIDICLLIWQKNEGKYIQICCNTFAIEGAFILSQQFFSFLEV